MSNVGVDTDLVIKYEVEDCTLEWNENTSKVFKRSFIIFASL